MRPLITVSCFDNLNASGLANRCLISGGKTVWANDRRSLPMEKVGDMLEPGDEFCLAITYHLGYQSVLKELKQSTRHNYRRGLATAIQLTELF